jgi:hypothetical protein
MPWSRFTSPSPVKITRPKSEEFLEQWLVRLRGDQPWLGPTRQSSLAYLTDPSPWV